MIQLHLLAVQLFGCCCILLSNHRVFGFVVLSPTSRTRSSSSSVLAYPTPPINRCRTVTSNQPTTSINTVLYASIEDDTTTVSTSASLESLNEIKGRLLKFVQKSPKPLASEVLSLVQEFENEATEIGIGQSSSTSGLLNGEWELVYASTDITRSSPFFWAFRKAFPDTADPIYDITDAIPSPLKEIGPAFQIIDIATSIGTGRFVSRVQVATFGGAATSIMTTRGTITGFVSNDSISIQIDTTKPEKSTVLSTLLGPFGDVINENLPAFPSGTTFERIAPGSSIITLQTTYVDETIRISRNYDRPDTEFFIWKRNEFAKYDFL